MGGRIERRAFVCGTGRSTAILRPVMSPIARTPLRHLVYGQLEIYNQISAKGDHTMSELAERSTGMFDKIGAGDKQRVLDSELGKNRMC